MSLAVESHEALERLKLLSKQFSLLDGADVILAGYDEGDRDRGNFIETVLVTFIVAVFVVKVFHVLLETASFRVLQEVIECCGRQRLNASRNEVGPLTDICVQFSADL